MSDALPRPARHSDESLYRLRANAALFTALEEAVIAALSNMARLARGAGAAGEAEQMEHAIRTHRVGLVRYRAILGAHGLDPREPSGAVSSRA